MSSLVKSRRSPGREYQAVVWLARHPGALVVPTVVGESLMELGATTTGLIAGGLIAGAGAWYRGHPDSFDTYAAPVLRAWRRRWAGAYVGPRWTALMSACDLTRTNTRTGRMLVPRVVRVKSWSAHIDTVRVAMVPGQSVKAFTAKAEELAATLRAERVAIEPHKPGQVVLVIQRDEPFLHTIPAPELAESVEDVDLASLYMGEDEFGREWREPLLGSHFFRVGATGSGKNSVPSIKLRAVAPLIRAGLVRPWVIDPKMMEFIALKPILDGRYADTPEDAGELLGEFVANMERKQKRMQRERLRSAPVSPEYPLDWLIIDEVGSLMAYRGGSGMDTIRQCALITSLGRSTHDVLEAMVQEPAKDIVPIRDLLPRRLCLRVTTDRHVDMALGEGARAKGAIADEIPDAPDTAGIGYAIRPRTRSPLRVRAAYTPDEGLRELVEYVKSPSAPNLRAVA